MFDFFLWKCLPKNRPEQTKLKRIRKKKKKIYQRTKCSEKYKYNQKN